MSTSRDCSGCWTGLCNGSLSCVCLDHLKDYLWAFLASIQPVPSQAHGTSAVHFWTCFCLMLCSSHHVVVKMSLLQWKLGEIPWPCVMQKVKQDVHHIQETINRNRNCTKISRGWLEERGSCETAQIYVLSWELKVRFPIWKEINYFWIALWKTIPPLFP